MYQRFFRLFILCFALGVCVLWPTPAHADGVAIQPDLSTISTGRSNASVDPYQSFNCTITLKAPNNGLPTATPLGKLYIWATDEDGAISNGLDVIAFSIPNNIFVHQTQRSGILIMDAASLRTPQSFNLKLATTGRYELHALYMPIGSIDLNDIGNYWPFELSGGAVENRTVVVQPTPSRDVRLMVVSSKIRGIEVDSFVIEQPRKQTLTTPISIDKNDSTPTEVQLTLLRSNGHSVGKNVPVYISTASSALTVSNVLVRTDANGTAHFKIHGAVGKNATLQLRCALNETPVTIPLQNYSYCPKNIRFTVGSNQVDVDGYTMTMDTTLTIKNNRTFVPFRFIGELLGAEIHYDSRIRTITASLDNKLLTMTLGYNQYAVNGKVHPMDVAPFANSDNRTMVPIRFIGDVFGYQSTPLYNPKGALTGVLFTKQAS